jgi:DNA invertase Pin-like site-specific DNA recombinase
MRVVTYSRVSTSHHEQNPEVQVHELRRYCGARGWSVVEEIVDHGYSGSTDTRPGLKRLLSMASTREVDCIVVLKLDRLFRSLKHLVTTLDEFEALGVQFVATKDNVDYTTPAGRLFVQVLGSLAEFEKSLLKERTMMGLAHARLQGKTLGRPRLNRDREVLVLHKKGLSYREIESDLNISRSTIQRIISKDMNYLADATIF